MKKKVLWIFKFIHKKNLNRRIRPTGWLNGTAITYNIPNGLAVGEYIYMINFTDGYNHFINDTVKMTITDTTNPILTSTPSDFSVAYGYTGVNISWTATDTNPNTYTIELQGTGVVAGPTFWPSGVAIIYNVPDGLAVGEYFYTVNFTDDYGNYIADTVILTIEVPIVSEPGIPGYELPIVIGAFVIASIGLICVIKKKRKL